MAYDWKITLKKGLIQVVIGGISFGIAYLSGLPAEQQGAIGVLLLALGNMALNYLKNRNA